MFRWHTSLNNNTHKGILIGRMWDTILVGDNIYDKERDWSLKKYLSSSSDFKTSCCWRIFNLNQLGNKTFNLQIRKNKYQ